MWFLDSHSDHTFRCWHICLYKLIAQAKKIKIDPEFTNVTIIITCQSICDLAVPCWLQYKHWRAITDLVPYALQPLLRFKSYLFSMYLELCKVLSHIWLLLILTKVFLLSKRLILSSGMVWFLLCHIGVLSAIIIQWNMLVWVPTWIVDHKEKTENFPLQIVHKVFCPPQHPFTISFHFPEGSFPPVWGCLKKGELLY